jgi:hypothetical protein
MEMEADKKKQFEFVMEVSFLLRKLMTERLLETFETHDERSAAFYSLLINFVGNSISEVSEPQRMATNMEEIIIGLKEWMTGTNITYMRYDPKTSKIKLGDLH